MYIYTMNNTQHTTTIVSVNDIVKTAVGRFEFQNELFRGYVSKCNNQWRVAITDKTKGMTHTSTYYATAKIAKSVLVDRLNRLPLSYAWNNAPAKREIV